LAGRGGRGGGSQHTTARPPMAWCQMAVLTFFKKTGTSSFFTGIFLVFIIGFIGLQEDVMLSAIGIMVLVYYKICLFACFLVVK
jgi:hypothetical protein